LGTRFNLFFTRIVQGGDFTPYCSDCQLRSALDPQFGAERFSLAGIRISVRKDFGRSISQRRRLEIVTNSAFQFGTVFGFKRAQHWTKLQLDIRRNSG
jgi:hypothetical protein